jgi:hypothetical protein
MVFDINIDNWCLTYSFKSMISPNLLPFTYHTTSSPPPILEYPSTDLPGESTTMSLPTLPRHLRLSTRLTQTLHQQRRHARVHDVRFVRSQQTASAGVAEKVLDKYRGKLEEKARS